MKKILLHLFFIALFVNLAKIVSAQESSKTKDSHIHPHQREALIKQTLRHIDEAEYKTYVKNKLFNGLSEQETQEAITFLKPIIKSEKNKLRREIWENNMSKAQLYHATDLVILDLKARLNSYKQTGSKGDDYEYLSDLFLNQRNNPKPDQVMASCTNAGFETGNTNGWVCTTGTNGGVANSGTPYDFTINATNDCSLAQIVTPGNDPVIPGLTRVPPGGGNFACLLNHTPPPNGSAGRISQTFTVSPTTTSFTVRYAVVLEDPITGHTTEEKPYFIIRVLDQSGNPFACADYSVIVDPGAPGFTKHVAGTLEYYWMNWQTVVVPLYNFVGQNVTLEVTVADCSATGHSGWAYVDASCDPLGILSSSPAICGGDFISLTAPAGGSSYSWSGPSGYSSTANPISVNVPGNYSVTVTPQAGSACSFTIDTVITGNPSRPTADFTSTVTCVGNPTQFTDASSPTGGITDWAWDFNNDGVNDNTTQNPSYTFPGPGTYPVKLSITWPPCIADTTLNVTVGPLPTAIFSSNTVCVGNPTVFNSGASVLNGGTPTYSWNFGEPTSGASNTSAAANPSHTYASAGTYTAYLSVTVDGICTHDTTMQVTVNALPTANFTVNTPCFGASSNFTDASSAGSGTLNSWVWIFNDPNNTNNTASIQNPSHLYTGDGTFNVTLVVTNTNGCSNDTTIPVTVYPVPQGTFAFTTFCEGITLDVNFNLITNGNLIGAATVNTPSTISGYAWDLDSNNTFEITGQTPSVSLANYPNAGTYQVAMQISTNNGCKDTVYGSFVVLPEPAVDAGPTQNLCLNDCVNLQGTTSAFSYQWDPPTNLTDITDLNTQACPRNTTVYTLIGLDGYTYPVFTTSDTVFCYNDDTVSVIVKPLPVVTFSSTQECLNFATSFTDQTTVAGSSAASWNWNFGDPTSGVNNTSTTQNPTHTYTNSGTFNATLEVTGANACINDTILPVVVDPLPQGTFAFTTFCEGITLDANFNLITNGNLLGLGIVDAPDSVTNYAWDLDSNSTFEITGQTPAVSLANYPVAGTYQVSMEITTNNGCKDTVSGSFIVLPEPAVDAGPTQNLCLNDCVNLQGTTTAISYQWDPPTGLTDITSLNTQACPRTSTEYTLIGLDGYTYPVFTTSDTVFCYNDDTASVIVKPLPLVTFTATQECLNVTTNFTDNTTVTGSSASGWDWNFADAASGVSNTSTVQNPTHTFTSDGTFNVMLEVTGANGCIHDTILPVIVDPLPVADFTFTNACADSANTFNASVSTVSSGTISNYQWDVNGTINSFEYTGVNASHNIGIDTTYDVTLVTTTNFGCTDTITHTITVWPIPVADFTFDIVCANSATSFNSISTINAPDNISVSNWDFENNGSTDAAGVSTSHTYTIGGANTVELMVKSNHGCTDSVTQSVYVNYIPTPDFTFVNQCYYDALSFSSTSSVTGPAICNGFSWAFGDGQTDSSTNAPTHLYASCNNYNVTLTVTTDSGCTANTSKTVQAYCKPNALFTTNDICEYQTANFNGTTSNVADGTITGYNWDFNLNGPFSSDASSAQPTNNYNDGHYLVGLIVESNFGCLDTITDSIFVYQKPVADFTPNAVCFGSPSMFRDTSTITAAGESITTWAWDFLNDGTVDNTQQHPQFIFPTSGSIPVQLVIGTNQNCYDTLQKNIQVNPIPVADFSAPNVCFNFPTNFTNNSTINGGTISSYSWTFGDGNNSVQTNPSHIYQAENQYTVCIWAQSDQACRDSVCKDVTVYPLPQANFFGDPLKGCEPLPVTFTNLSSVTSVNPNSTDQISTYDWVYGDGAVKTTSDGSSVINVYDAGTYTVTLTVTTNHGCIDDTTFYNYVISHPMPVAEFAFMPQPTTVLEPTILFMDASTGGDTVYWDFGDSTSAIVVNEIGEGFYHQYSDSGKYIVTQIVQTEFGCVDTVRKTVYIGPDWTLYVPNAFTPNGDNINDFFKAMGIGIIEFEMRIYDRWGNFISKGDYINDKLGWNGKVQQFDEDCQQDVYVYRINFTDIFSKRHQLTGTFTLVR